MNVQTILRDAVESARSAAEERQIANRAQSFGR